MTRQLAIIENGMVVNRIIGDPGFAGGIECDPSVGIGWAYEGGDFIAPPLPETPPPGAANVDRERDRRIASGFDFNGVRYQSRQEDRENMAGASTAALAAMMQGAQPGNLRWHGGDSDFVWIAEDNSLNAMDAQTVFALGQAAMAHKQAMIFAARAIKDADPIPADFADDGYWP